MVILRVMDRVLYAKGRNLDTILSKHAYKREYLLPAAHWSKEQGRAGLLLPFSFLTLQVKPTVLEQSLLAYSYSAIQECSFKERRNKAVRLKLKSKTRIHWKSDKSTGFQSDRHVPSIRVAERVNNGCSLKSG